MYIKLHFQVLAKENEVLTMTVPLCFKHCIKWMTVLRIKLRCFSLLPEKVVSPPRGPEISSVFQKVIIRVQSLLNTNMLIDTAPASYSEPMIAATHNRLLSNSLFRQRLCKLWQYNQANNLKYLLMVLPSGSSNHLIFLPSQVVIIICFQTDKLRLSKVR